MNRLFEILVRIGGYVFGLITIFIGFVVWIIPHTPHLWEYGLIVFFLLISVTCFIKSALLNKKAVKQKESKIEKMVVKKIIEKKGRITPWELSAESELNLDEAKKILHDLSIKSLTSQQITENGKMLYVFPEVVLEEEKYNLKKDWL